MRCWKARGVYTWCAVHMLCDRQRRFFEGRRESMKGRAALAASRAKYLLASKPSR